MIFTITLPAVKAAIVGLIYVLGYSIGHADGELSAYDYMSDWFLHMLRDGEDNAE